MSKNSESIYVKQIRELFEENSFEASEDLMDSLAKELKEMEISNNSFDNFRNVMSIMNTHGIDIGKKGEFIIDYFREAQIKTVTKEDYSPSVKLKPKPAEAKAIKNSEESNKGKS